MGETGCGKTELIKQLIKLLNNGEEDCIIIKNMHSGVKEIEIKEIIDEAKNKIEKSTNGMICIFFDEINTTTLLSKMKEIFVNHSFNGKKIDENIRFIGACNPFRKKEKDENDIGLRLNEEDEEMTYLVNPLPNSLLNFIFYFKSLDGKDVIKYIDSIIGEEFPKEEDEYFRKNVIDAIHKSHVFVREKNGKSSVSLRDLQRFRIAYKFFNDYYDKKNQFLKVIDSDKTVILMKSKIISFVLSLYITYYIRIFKWENEYTSNINDIIVNLIKHFKISQLSNDQNITGKNADAFKTLVKYEEEFLVKEMDLKKETGIGINNSLKANIFLMFFSIYSHVPLIIVGKPGCSKSLSIQLIIRFMRGEFSNSNFLKNYPSINCTNFQGSETNTPESIENIFKIAEDKIDKSSDENKVISLLVLDELGLSEKSPTNCLKVLHSKLEISLKDEQNKISFIGLSNWK